MPEEAKEIIVIGAGQAALSFAAKFRELDQKCNITLIGAEAALPYQRPPLSKKYMTGEIDASRLLLRPAAWFEDARIACVTSAPVAEMSPADKTVRLVTGEQRRFDALLLATGSTPRRLPAEMGGSLPGVHVLRSIEDAGAISSELKPGRKALVVGGGYIGLEAAAVAATRGLDVVVCEMARRILQRVACEATSDYFRRLHASHGVRIMEGVTLARLEHGPNGRVARAVFADDAALDVDFVLVGIGVSPNVELAAAAGLAIDNGIAVDCHARTSHPDIYAAGDCASFELRGRRVRLESVQNAIDQAEIAAVNAAGGEAEYRPVPWFWSDQYDCKLQIAGLNIGYDLTVVRPGQRPDSQSVWYFAGEEFLAVDAMNDPRAYMFGKRILEMGRSITPEQARNTAFDLRSLIS